MPNSFLSNPVLFFLLLGVLLVGFLSAGDIRLSKGKENRQVVQTQSQQILSAAKEAPACLKSLSSTMIDRQTLNKSRCHVDSV